MNRLLSPSLLVLALAAPMAFAQDGTGASKDVPIPKKEPPPAGSEDVAPSVTIRTADNGDRVEEYREGGKVYMVRIVPVRGKPYYLYDDDRNGRLDRSDADRHTIAPVYWTLYEWD
jgi:hypothetical protein